MKKNPENNGHSVRLEEFRAENMRDGFETGRVSAVHKERYIVSTAGGEYEAEITGNMRFTAKSIEDFPAVGDWVAMVIYEPDTAIIHRIFPRFSIIKREAVGRKGEVQVIAANIDYAFLVQAADRDFSINRLERYLTICYSSGVSPVIILSKIDLVADDQLSAIIGMVEDRLPDVPLFPLSNESEDGYERVRDFIVEGRTYCLLGSSGVGKSTLINNLAGRERMRTGAISSSTNRGRHVTSHREMIILDNGGILVDNPGMREVGIADSPDGLEMTFDKIMSRTTGCRFIDCSHTTEKGCAVIEAVDRGDIDRASYDNWLKMEREKRHYESTVAERRKKEKEFGKIVKHYKKIKDKSKK